MQIDPIELSENYSLAEKYIERMARADGVYIIRTISKDVVKKYELTSPINIHPFGPVWEKAVMNDTTDGIIYSLINKRSVLVLVS